MHKAAPKPSSHQDVRRRFGGIGESDRESDTRLPRSEIQEDANSHLWAVSYSDLLMVLLAFFILFFSFDQSDVKKDDKLSLLQEISVALKGTTSTEGAKETGIQTPSLPGGASSAQSNIYATSQRLDFSGVMKSLESSGLPVEAVAGPDQFIISFNETLFGVGSVEILPSQVEHVRAILKTLVAFRDRVNLEFLGHADLTPFSPKNIRRPASNNRDISALRATSVLRVAEALGFEASRMVASGAGEFQKNMRTVSIVVKRREVKP
jgi:chemotaxis protein MotB